MFSFPPMMFAIPGQPPQMLPPMFFPPTAGKPGMMLPPPWMLMGCPPFPDVSALMKAAGLPPAGAVKKEDDAPSFSFPRAEPRLGSGDRVSGSGEGEGWPAPSTRQRRESAGSVLFRPEAARPTCSLTSATEQLLRSLSATSLCTMAGNGEAAQQALPQLPPVAPLQLLQPSLHSAFAPLR